MSKSSKLFVGMDVHKDSIDVATGDDSASEARHYGAIGGEMAAVSRLARLGRAEELTPIHVPDAADEAMRDLVRARLENPR